MASPQCENGYTRIANELLDALIKFCPGGSQGQVLLAVIRKTYGFQKKEDQVSISQIQKATCLSRRTVIYAIQNLEAKHMLIVKRKKASDNLNRINKISIQKKYTKWVVQGISNQYAKTLKQQRKAYTKAKKGVVQGLEGSARIGKRGEILAPTKETRNTKEIKNKHTVETFSKSQPSEFCFSASKKIMDHVSTKKNIKTSNGKIRKGADAIRLLMKMDLPGTEEQKEERISDSLNWLIDNYEGQYTPVVESGGSFRKKFTKIENQMKKGEAVDGVGFVPKWDKDPDLMFEGEK